MIKINGLKFIALCIASIMILSFCGCRKINFSDDTSSSLSISAYDADNNSFLSSSIATSDNEEAQKSDELESSEKVNSNVLNNNNAENDNQSSLDINIDNNSDDYNFDIFGDRVKRPSPDDYHTPAITNTEDRYATLQLNTLTTYYGYIGFFNFPTEDALSLYFVAEKLGIVEPGEEERIINSAMGVESYTNENSPYGYQSEFYDKDSEKIVYFYALGVNNAHDVFYDYVLEVNEGWGTIPVHVKENDDLIKSIKNIKLYELTEFHGIKGYFSDYYLSGTDEISLKLLGPVRPVCMNTKYKNVILSGNDIYFNYYDEYHNIQFDISSDSIEWVYITK